MYGHVFRKRYGPQHLGRPRQLKNLTIDEVSSVSAGAGRGVRVLLMKSDNNEGNDVMTQVQKVGGGHTYHSIAKAAVEAASNGEISEHRFGEVQKMLAMSMFPTAPNEGVALSKFFATAVGAATLAARPKLSPQANAALMKRESAEFGKGGAHAAENPGHVDEHDDDEHSGPVKSPYMRELETASEDHRQKEAGKGNRLSPEQAFSHVATETKAGRTLMSADLAFHQHHRRG